MTKEEMDALFSITPEQLLGYERVGDLGYMKIEDEPPEPVKRAAPVVRPAPKPAVRKTLKELQALPESEQVEHLKRLKPSYWNVQQLILVGFQEFEKLRLAPMHETIAKREAENVRLRGEMIAMRDTVNSAVKPFVPTDAPQDGDSERWQ
jgi:hypothetical protein